MYLKGIGRKLFGGILLLAGSSVSFAADSTELTAAYDVICAARPDSTNTIEVANLTINHQDLTITFDSARVSFFEPVTLDSAEIVFGAYVEGRGRFQYTPPVSMERDQLNRFFHTDSLNRPFEKMFLLFTPEIYETIRVAQQRRAEPLEKGQIEAARKMRDQLAADGNEMYFFEVLQSIALPIGRPFLVVSVEPEDTDRLIYRFNPYDREEVSLYKHFRQPGESFMELVCSYSQYNIDESYRSINGLSKNQLQTEHYAIDAAIDDAGRLFGKAEVTYEVVAAPAQMATFRLHEALRLDSVVGPSGERISFVRDKLDVSFKDYESPQFGVILDRSRSTGEKLNLTYYYHGTVAEKEAGEFFVTAGADWYPEYGWGQRAVFDITFRTPKQYVFTAAGRLLEEKRSKDTLITVWKVLPAAHNVSFAIGNMEKSRIESDDNDVVPVDVYFSKSLHDDFAREMAAAMMPSGKDMEKQVAEDVQNALRVFSYYFGPYPYDHIAVSEILAMHGEAFPGFLHLGFQTWVNTDKWGEERMFRAHEVAHQWWGVGMSPATYHDTWLSEGFAEYSALLYYQVVAGKEDFLDKLKDYRNDVFSVRQYILGSGEESGPIALGPRTSSTKTEGDYGLIIYKKGALVLHMLRNLLIDLQTMNEDRFFTMLKEFYQANRGKEVSTADFQRLTEKYTGMDMTWFFNQWVYRSELPTYDFTYQIQQDPKGGYTAHGRIITRDVGEDFVMAVPLEIELDQDSRIYVRLAVDKPDFEFSLPGLPRRPKKLTLNPFESVLAKVKQ